MVGKSEVPQAYAARQATAVIPEDDSAHNNRPAAKAAGLAETSKEQANGMRQWAINANGGNVSDVLVAAIPQLGEMHFEHSLLDGLHAVLPAASCAVYRTGNFCKPTFFMSASRGIPDTTLDCWRAYLSGPYLSDQSLYRETSTARPSGSQLSHITAQEVPPEHRAKVYEAHGVAERLSIVEPQGDGALFAINFYRHQHQRPFSDAQIGAFEQLAPALLALTHKHLALRVPSPLPVARLISHSDRRPATLPPRQYAFPPEQLRAINPALTERECEVCAGILHGLTADGIACQLGLSVPTVKTYHNRAFARLGIHFRNELFALVWKAKG